MNSNYLAIKAITHTYLKSEPGANIDDVNQYVVFAKDKVLEIDSYSDEPGTEHYEIILKESPEGFAKRNWYVFKPHVKILN